MLLKLWISTKRFLERFWGIDHYPLLEEGILVFDEECGEFKEAILNGTVTESCEEIADVIVTMMQLILTKGGEYWDIEMAVLRVIRKNDDKTEATHSINEDGKIARINNGQH